ncbi:unnamed protein product [Brachionus calyciflorus]|uniref:Methyltransferase-like protein 5 n=1 Tax=Brachionus calyciflorus TaxID=104777 RepID=A0A813W9F5_9BILA|nr:unnamed protein product [Brachionus calyciflorus]
MKLKELESHLQEIETFTDPKLYLEQYITTPHLASQIAFNIDKIYDDIHSKNLCEFGIGTGMLTIACSFFEPSYSLGVDIDTDALAICQKNLDYFELENPVDLIQADVKQLLLKKENYEKFSNLFDTCVMNPPFGTKNQRIETEEKQLGIDIQFLKIASEFCSNSVYSLHKSVTREYIKIKAKQWNMKMEVVSELKYNIPKVDSRNKKLIKDAKEKDIAVDFLRLTHII